MSNDMRNLMESLARIQLEEGWEPDAIAQAIYDEFNTEGSPLQQVAQDSPEPYRAMIYAYGNATGLYNPETLDGSEIYHAIVDGIEDRFWENVSSDDVKRAQLGEDYHDDEVQRFYDMGKRDLWILYNNTLEDEDYPGRTDELQYMEAALERYGVAVAEGLGEDYRDDPNRPGWQDKEGNWHKYKDVPCSDCDGQGDIQTSDGEVRTCASCEGWGYGVDGDPAEVIRKSRLIKDIANDIDLDWTDLEMADVDPVDLKGFPKINESFTRKHFQMVADTLQKIEDPEVRRAQAEEYAAQFAAANPRFNRDLFMAAAGVEELNEKERKMSDDEIRQRKRDEEKGITGAQMWDRLVKADQVGGTKTKRGENWFEDAGPGDDEEWDAHWARMDGDDERADDLDWDAEFARMDAGDEPQECPVCAAVDFTKDEDVYTCNTCGHWEDADIIDEATHNFFDIMRTPSSRPDDEEPYVPRDRHAERPHTPGYDKQSSSARAAADSRAQAFIFDEGELTEETSEFRLAEIIGKDGLADLINDLNTEGEIEYGSDHFSKLYDFFATEYPDEIPVGHRTGRPDDPVEYVMDNLYNKFEDELRQYTNVFEETDGKVIDYPGEESWEEKFMRIANDQHERELYNKCADDEMNKAILGEEDDDGDVPSRRVSDEELLQKIESKLYDAIDYVNAGMKAEQGNGDAKFNAITLRRYLKEVVAFIQSGGDPLGLRQKATVAFKQAEELADLSYHFDNVLWEMNDIDNLLYLHLTGRPVAIDEAGCPCGEKGCECGPDCECEPVEEDQLNEEYYELGQALAILAQAFGYLTASAIIGWVIGDMGFVSGDDDGAIRPWLRKIRQRLNLTPTDFKVSKLIDRAYQQDPEFKELVDKYMKPDGSFKSNGLGAIEKYVSAKGVEEIEPFIYKLRGFRQNNPVEETVTLDEVSLDGIAESLLNEYRNQPKDYEMSDEELASEIEDETSEFERDHIDKEIEDEELGLRFD